LIGALGVDSVLFWQDGIMFGLMVNSGAGGALQRAVLRFSQITRWGGWASTWMPNGSLHWKKEE
jgi:hypothetical protein